MDNGNIILLGTEFCHLCDQAEVLLENYCQQQKMAFIKIDIIDHEQLLKQFRTRIPVILYHHSSLCWPFDNQDLSLFLHQH